MIIHKIHDLPTAQQFHKRAQECVIFVKFYSPTCPACIASEEEWDNLKSKLEPEKPNNFDLAEVDPDGLRELQDHKYDKMNINIQFVPTFAVMKNGKVAEVYEGERNHKDMIQFLKDKKYLKEYNEMSEGDRCMQRGGGRASRSNKKKKSKKRKTMKTRKGKHSRSKKRKHTTRKKRRT